MTAADRRLLRPATLLTLLLVQGLIQARHEYLVILYALAGLCVLWLGLEPAEMLASVEVFTSDDQEDL